MKARRHTCVRAELLLICVCLLVFMYLGYMASLQRSPVTDVQLLLQSGHPEQDLCRPSEKWILVNVSGSDKSDLALIKDVKGWRLLIMDLEQRRKPFLHRCTNCLYITDRIDLIVGWNPGNILDLDFIPLLYMLRRGASWIYVTTEPTKLQLQIQNFRLGRSWGLVPDITGFFSLSSHFLSATSTSITYRVKDWPKLSIQTRWQPEKKVKFNPQMCLATPLMLPSSVLGLTDISLALYAYEAFWSLVSSVSKTGRFVWSLWKQRLLWEIEGSVGVLSPHHCDNLTDSQRLIPPNRDSVARLISFLKSWRCQGRSVFFNCVRSLTKALWDESFFSAQDVYYVNVWTEYLSKLNYEEPAIARPRHNGTGFRTVYNSLTPVTRKSNTAQNPFIPLCKRHRLKSVNLPKRTNLNEDIVLIVVFPHSESYHTVNYLNYMYSRYFRHIVYCGEALHNFMKVTKSYKTVLNFIEILTSQGKYGYKCMTGVMKMGLNVRGYLQMNHDVLVNFKQIVKLPKEKPWYQNNVSLANLSAENVPNLTPLDPEKRKFWWPWASPYGVSRLRNLWARFKLSTNNRGFEDFLQMIKRNAHGVDKAYYEASDIFYIPHSLRERFVYFSQYFENDWIYHDIAVPTILHGLSRAEDIVRLNGSYLWFSDKRKYINRYRTNNHFLHPWDIRVCINNTRDAEFLCNTYLPRIS